MGKILFTPDSPAARSILKNVRSQLVLSLPSWATQEGDGGKREKGREGERGLGALEMANKRKLFMSCALVPKPLKRSDSIVNPHGNTIPKMQYLHNLML